MGITWGFGQEVSTREEEKLTEGGDYSLREVWVTPWFKAGLGHSCQKDEKHAET